MAHFLAFGIPTVTSDLTIFRETFKMAKCGLISRTDKDYIENIVNILSDKNLKNTLSKKALEFVEKELSWDIIAKKTEKVYNHVLNKNES